MYSTTENITMQKSAKNTPKTATGNKTKKPLILNQNQGCRNRPFGHVSGLSAFLAEYPRRPRVSTSGQFPPHARKIRMLLKTPWVLPDEAPPIKSKRPKRCWTVSLLGGVLGLAGVGVLGLVRAGVLVLVFSSLSLRAGPRRLVWRGSVPGGGFWVLVFFLLLRRTPSDVSAGSIFGRGLYSYFCRTSPLVVAGSDFEKVIRGGGESLATHRDSQTWMFPLRHWRIAARSDTLGANGGLRRPTHRRKAIAAPPFVNKIGRCRQGGGRRLVAGAAARVLNAVNNQ